MNSDKYGKLRERDVSAPVTITLPAHVWLTFMSAYSVTDFVCPAANAIVNEAQDALYDPVWRREQEAEAQRKHSEQHEMLGRIIPGFPPSDDGIPPDAQGL